MLVLLSQTLVNGALAMPLLEAEAGLDFIAYPGQTVELNGAGSGADDLDYAWRRISGPPVELDDSSIANPRFTPDQPGTHTFELTVTAEGESSVPDAISVVVVHTDAGEVNPGGCAVGPGGPWLLALLPLLWRLRDS
ncbi:MAG TPA: hypothetical protein QGF58_18020 [Myxococcota bacterium]|nr:hypothetical protein [Myxococcota bacterium]